MHSLQEYIEAELSNRKQLKEKILSLINDRCTTGHGRVQRGALHLYLYRKLGFHGHPGNAFAKYITKILTEEGYRDSYLIGKRCYYGLSFKGEKPENWNKPVANDIPKWMDNIQKFEFMDNL